MNNMLEALKKAFEDPQTMERINKRLEKEALQKAIFEKQLNKFHQMIINGKINFSNVVEKIIAKYSSDEYYYRWIDRGIMPHESLYFFLYYFAQKFGRSAYNYEWGEYGNDFTRNLFIFDEYVFQIMDGQGSCVRIDVLKEPVYIQEKFACKNICESKMCHSFWECKYVDENDTSVE